MAHHLELEVAESIFAKAIDELLDDEERRAAHTLLDILAEKLNSGGKES